MQLGIIGLPTSGKTTIFNALTRGNAATSAVSSGKLESHVGTVAVADPRVDRLSTMFMPRKTIYAQIRFNDVAGLQKGISSSGGLSGALLTQLSQNDALVYVIRAFEDDAIPHSEGTVDPRRDIQILETELILSDMSIVERRMERVDASLKKAKADERDAYLAEQALLARLAASLEQEIPVRDVEMTPAEEKILRGFQLMTQKPVLLILNVGDGDPDRSAEMQGYSHQRTAMVVLRGRLEAEIAQLDPADAAEFLSEYDIDEPGLNRAVRLAYDLLGLMSFFTVGEDEVRAWTVDRGATAVAAAGAIHTDLQRGFIRAEVISYKDMLDSGTMAVARAKGLLRLEGRDYVVQDGDILNIRFNI
jgi:GTP-binding protein YchF